MSRNAADPYRLPTSVLPTHYEITLEPDLAAASFRGSVRIALEVREPVAKIVLNVKELTLRDVSLSDRAGGVVPLVGVSVDGTLERASLSLDRMLEPGRHDLRVSFTGILNDKLAGFYRSTFTDEGGHRQTIATTQLQSTDARRAFPCFDEPAFKATFGVTLVVPENLFAVSNAPVVSDEPAGRGRRRIRFADTMKMSSYLVACAVGPFETTDPVDVDGVPLRIVHPRGKGRLTAFALRAAAHALRFFSDYYGIPYPGRKLDLVAIPDFAFGAMENLGCITFREVLLLVDEARATQGELLRVADVVAHEIAHMWFGDLVTMRWWNGVWLNEAFATFMATLCTDAFRPEWRRWEQFSRERSAAFDVDSLTTTRPIEYEVQSPADAEGMFDLLTYEKGASVVRMLEQYLGETRFRDGIREYLRRHAYANTETGDLWDAIEAMAGEPVRRIMDSWIFQPGHPMISVSRPEAGTLELRQRRFFYAGPSEGEDALWAVPLVLRCSVAGSSEEKRSLLESTSARLAIDGRSGWVLANVGSHGFYRVRYSPELLHRIADRMMTDLDSVERYTLVDDAWASVLSGASSSASFLAFVRRFSGETDLDVWAALTGCLEGLDRIVEGEARGRYRAVLRGIYGPALDRAGWRPTETDPARLLELRALLIRALAVLAADPDAAARSRALHDAYLEDPSSVEPNVAAAVAAAVAFHGSGSDYRVFAERSRRAQTPQEERRYRSLLAAFPGGPEMERTLEMTLDGTVRTQDAPYLLAECLVNREQGALAWHFIEQHWDRMLREYPDNAVVRMLAGVRGLSKPDVAERVRRFFETHPVPKGQRTLDQHLEKLRVNVSLREREAGRLAQTLAAGAGVSEGGRGDPA